MPDLAASPAPPARHGADAIISYDPMRGEWLVLHWQRSVPGMPVWTVLAAHVCRAEAERMVGWHEAPVRHWLAHDLVMGWHRGPGTWVARLELARYLTEAEAKAMLRADGRLALFVIRANGRTTCPDIAA